MKNTKLVKGVIILALSLGVIFVNSSNVFAVDDDLFSDAYENAEEVGNISDNNTADNAVGNNTIGNNTIGNNTIGNNTIGNNTIGNSAIGNNTAGNNSVTNRNVSNTNQLADTGIGQTGGIIALIMVVGIISAIYSYKKVDDYKKL